jgi:hypothetical protein
MPAILGGLYSIQERKGVAALHNLENMRVYLGERIGRATVITMALRQARKK